MSMNKIYIPYLLLATISLALLSVQADVYRWVDKDGAVHFGDKPANKQSAEKVEIKSNAGTGNQNQSNRLKRQQHLLSVMDEERKINEQKQAMEKKDKQVVISNCKRARKMLDNYLRSGVLFDVDKSGNKIYLSDQQREEAIKRARDDVEYWCK